MYLYIYIYNKSQVTKLSKPTSPRMKPPRGPSGSFLLAKIARISCSWIQCAGSKIAKWVLRGFISPSD